MEIHQILPDIVFGDAISNHAVEIRDILHSWGYNSNIYALRIHPKMRKFSKSYSKYTEVSSHENILIYHASIGSDLFDFVINLPDKKILIYHNITPPKYFKGVNSTLEYLLEKGKIELKMFIDNVKLALGDSEYNKHELDELGFDRTGVLPIIVDFKKYDLEPNRKIMDKYNDDYVNILYVGRIAPNKKYEDIIRTFYYYKNYINQHSRLFFVGSYMGMEKYYSQLIELIRRLHLKDIQFTELVDLEELIAYYKLADVFISMSEHEGFCVPLLESMYFKIPIIAYNSTAIPYTLDKAGILVNEKNYEEIAETINLVVEDDKLRNKIIKRQNERLKDFEKSKVEKILGNYIKEVLD